MGTYKRIVILPDTQIPLDDERLIRRFIRFLEVTQPDELASVGDFTDSTEVSRWSQGRRAEYVYGGLEGGFDRARGYLEDIRAVYDGPFNMVRSNHDDRLENEIERRLPGLAGLTISGKVINIEYALRLDEFGVKFHHRPYQIAPNWLLAHGDEGTLSQIPGQTALNLAKELGENIVCGHTHRAGLLWSSYGSITTGHKPRVGMEVGHMMDLANAHYLKHARKNNWGTAFGILHVIQPGSKKRIQVYPELVPIQPDGSFVVDSVVY